MQDTHLTRRRGPLALQEKITIDVNLSNLRGVDMQYSTKTCPAGLSRRIDITANPAVPGETTGVITVVAHTLPPTSGGLSPRLHAGDRREACRIPVYCDARTHIEHGPDYATAQQPVSSPSCSSPRAAGGGGRVKLQAATQRTPLPISSPIARRDAACAWPCPPPCEVASPQCRGTCMPGRATCSTCTWRQHHPSSPRAPFSRHAAREAESLGESVGGERESPRRSPRGGRSPRTPATASPRRAVLVLRRPNTASSECR